jgi:hypothetical protein
VVDALTALSVRLGVRGVLSEEEFVFAQLVFGKGMPAKLAARQLKLTESAVRRSIQEKFHAALRKRTTLRQPTTAENPLSDLNRRESERASLRSKVPQMNQEKIIAALWRLRQNPEIHSRGDQKVVSLGDGDVTVTEIRSILAENEDLCDDLIAEGTPLDWVFTHDGQRVDVFPGEDEFSEEIETIASREWTVAQFVLGECIKNIGEQKLPVLTAPSATGEPVARIVETLAGLSVALSRTIDARLRQKHPPLCIWQETEKAYAQWEGGPQKFELTPFILRQAIRFGEFRPDAATVVANTVTTLLANGALSLPGFDLEPPTKGLQILRPQQPH